MNTQDDPLDEHERAAMHYVVWPLAVFDTFRSHDATLWSRLHARQAALFGASATLGYFALLALPFVVAVLFGSLLGTSGTIWLYACFFVADVAAAVALAVLSIRYSMRARRGDLFTIGCVSAMSDRIFAGSGDRDEPR